MIANHSLTTRVTDGFTAPRWVHYLVKLATGVVAWALLYAILRSLDASHAAAGALGLSALWFLTLHGHYWLDHRADVNAPAQLWTFDLVCDFTLHVWIPLMLVAPFPLNLGVGVICAFTFWISYPYSSP